MHTKVHRPPPHILHYVIYECSLQKEFSLENYLVFKSFPKLKYSLTFETWNMKNFPTQISENVHESFLLLPPTTDQPDPAKVIPSFRSHYCSNYFHYFVLTPLFSSNLSVFISVLLFLFSRPLFHLHFLIPQSSAFIGNDLQKNLRKKYHHLCKFRSN